jgi:hypothetical protein
MIIKALVRETANGEARWSVIGALNIAFRQGTPPRARANAARGRSVE